MNGVKDVIFACDTEVRTLRAVPPWFDLVHPLSGFFSASLFQDWPSQIHHPAHLLILHTMTALVRKCLTLPGSCIQRLQLLGLDDRFGALLSTSTKVQ